MKGKCSSFQAWIKSQKKAKKEISKNPYIYTYNHSHKKRKDSLEGSLDRVLFAAELESPKILVPRLPQHTSNVNTDCLNVPESHNNKKNCILYM